MPFSIRVKNSRSLVQKFDKERNRISLSLKALQKNPWIAAIEKFEVGDIVKGEVKKLLPFGAILAIDPELQGLLHISELTEKRGVAVKDLVNIGDVMNVKIIGIDTDKKKISLSVLAIQKDEEEQEVRNYLDNQDKEEETTRFTKGIAGLYRLSIFSSIERILPCTNP